MQFNAGLLSTGRNHGTGFVKDRRRVNVALSRFKDSVIVLLNDAIGRETADATYFNEGQAFWMHLRQYACKLGTVIELGPIANEDVSEAAKTIVTFMLDRPAIPPSDMRESISEHAEFFNNYQKDIVGSFDGRDPLPDSDSDVFSSGDEDEAMEKHQLVKQLELEDMDYNEAVDAQNQTEEEERDRHVDAALPCKSTIIEGTLGCLYFAACHLNQVKKFYRPAIYFHEKKTKGYSRSTSCRTRRPHNR